MARLVLKFGGTSVANVERIRNVAARVKRAVDAGNEVAVVVSAMSGQTNQLVAWVNEISKFYDPREYDAVVSTGEQVTSGLTALALQELGLKALPGRAGRSRCAPTRRIPRRASKASTPTNSTEP